MIAVLIIWLMFGVWGYVVGNKKNKGVLGLYANGIDWAAMSHCPVPVSNCPVPVSWYPGGKSR